MIRWAAAVSAVLLGVVATGAVPANATPDLSDPHCLVAPYLPECLGGPFDDPPAAPQPLCLVQSAAPGCVGPPPPAAEIPIPIPPPPIMDGGIPGMTGGMGI